MEGPNYEQTIDLCDYTYTITYSMDAGKAQFHTLDAGADAKYTITPPKLLLVHLSDMVENGIQTIMVQQHTLLKEDKK